jgi:gamma-glutamyl-gamma-aminobutyrate hydrolase PuuD
MNLNNIYYNENNPFPFFDSTSHNTEPTKKDCLVLWGGEDIATEIYNETPQTYQSPYQKTKRDNHEISFIQKALSLNIPMIGVCRGAQLINCVLGGKLIQDIKHHCGPAHSLHTYENELITTNSAHHQALIVTEEAEVLAKSIDKYKIPEIVWYPKYKALLIQGHPEWKSLPKSGRNFFNSLIKKLIIDNESLYLSS